MASTAWPPEPVAPDQPSQSAGNAAFWRVALLIALSVVANTMVGVFTGEKLSFLYKDALHLSASDVGTLGLIVGIPSYLRPFMGAWSDLFPLFGLHRRSYYAISWLLYAVGFLALAFLHAYHYVAVVCLALVTAAGANLLFVIMDAVMVAVGNLTGQIGRLQTIQQGVPLLLALTFASQLRGWVTQHWSYTHCFTAGGIVALIAISLTWLIDERSVSASGFASEDRAAREARRREERAQTAATLLKAASSGHLWAIVGFVFYLILTPGTNTAMFYYEVDSLHFSKLFIGQLGMPGAAGAILAILLFVVFSRKVSVRTVVWTAYLMDCSLYLISMLLRNHTTAVIVMLTASLFGMVYNLSLLTLAARATPKGIEGTVYGLVMSAIYFAGALGEKIGATIYTFFGPPHHSTAHGWFSLLWFGFAFTVIAVVFIPFLPAWARSRESLGSTVQHTPE